MDCPPDSARDRPAEHADVGVQADERARLLSAWQATQRPCALGPWLHTPVEQQALHTPDAVAVVAGEQTLTYGVLERRAEELAAVLQRAGVGPEIFVALFVQRSPEMVSALLAILKAGGAYLPLELDLPAERLAFLLRDGAPAVLLTRTELRDRLPASYRGQILLLDERPAEAGALRPWQGHPLQAANLLYTSGSTGQPKGVVNTHAGLSNRLFWMQDRYQLQQSDRVLQKTPYSFDVSLWEILWPLHRGATLVLARPEGHRDSAYLAGLISEQRVSVAHFVPSMLHLFVDEPALRPCPALRALFCSGEVLSAALQERCFARLDADLHNLYGPTEAAIDVTAWACRRESRVHSVPIGSPIYNTQILLLDRQGAFVPVGEPGELCIGGVGLARGYYRRPDLTAASFRPHPASPQPGARIYLTGDLACEGPEQVFAYLGRLDHQVKLRGQRIELEEIEIALQRHPGVRSCLVQAQNFADNDQRLVAYLIAAGDRRPAIKELLGFLRLCLPAYMVPSVFLFLDAWPLLPNGKINRQALPAASTRRGLALAEEGPAVSA